MGWRELVGDELVTAPWLGGRALAGARGRRYQLEGPLPLEHGWHEFAVSGGRRASWKGPSLLGADAFFEPEAPRIRGWLVGDRLVPDSAAVTPDVSAWLPQTRLVHLVERGLDRYTRIAACELDGRLFFAAQELPLGPEDAVRDAFVAREPSVDGVPNVPPGLDLAFRVESWQRDLVEGRRIALELDDGQARRVLARRDYTEAARRALRVTGAELLDHRPAFNRGEHVVQFRFRGRRFECVCDDELRIVDAGICLNDYETGARGDTLFTLESLPSVIGEAIDGDVLVVFRHLEGP